MADHSVVKRVVARADRPCMPRISPRELSLTPLILTVSRLQCLNLVAISFVFEYGVVFGSPPLDHILIMLAIAWLYLVVEYGLSTLLVSKFCRYDPAEKFSMRS